MNPTTATRLSDARSDAETGYYSAPREVILCDNNNCENTAERAGELCEVCKAKNEGNEA